MTESSSDEGIHSILPDLILGNISPDEMLDAIVAELHSTDDMDEELCLEIGRGDLESVLARHEAALWDRIELLARSDPRFRRALRSVWAYGSPLYDRRAALLGELPDP